MTREEALNHCLSKENISLESQLSVYNVSLDKFMGALILGSSLTRNLGVNQRIGTKILQTIFPNKPRSNIKLCTWLLEKNGLKSCTKCRLCLELKDFYKESGRRSGLANSCKACSRTKESTSMPKWANIQKIAEIYANTPEGCHVDHVIPLKGKNVCGLHVENNLSYLPARINMSKSNKMPEEYFFANRLKRPTQFEGTKITS